MAGLCIFFFASAFVISCAKANEEVFQDVARLCDQFCVVRSDTRCQKKAMPKPDIYVSMDKIDGSEVAATGLSEEVTVRGSPKPSLVPGKVNYAIQLQNTQTLDDKFIDLGYLRGRCADNLEKCKDGLTVSIWFWHEYIYDWPVIMSASQWQIHTHGMPRKANEVYMSFFRSDGMKRYMLGGHWNTSVSDEQWHHVAFVFRGYDNIRLFVDGELNAETIRFDKDMSLTDKHVQIGCHMGGNCMRGKFDELKIWEQALSDEDIKNIYNQKDEKVPIIP